MRLESSSLKKKGFSLREDISKNVIHGTPELSVPILLISIKASLHTNRVSETLSTRHTK